jgi:AcrR family transcriptional regulator
VAKVLPVQDRREQLLDAALAVFSAGGYSAAKVSDIVGRAGVAQGTFYLYFRSKQEVMLALFERFERALIDARCRREPAAPTTPEQLRAAVLEKTRAILGAALEHRQLAALFMKEPVGADHELAGRLREFHQRMADLSEQGLRQAAAAGLIRPVDPRVAALAINGMWERVLTDCLLADADADGPDLDSLAAQIVSLQLDGLLDRPTPGTLNR